ncbi:hypothetical protein AAZV13_07G199000 [Glycine max]|uniref:Myb/SANT-like domain-containing protein n=2 Tax=Glycine max TaxID=3847 RepID=A0A0R0J7D0_SOYBN|nr:uncharacterized protein LOC100785875 isoform X2 [Glycine max]|eukprot:XP_006583988.2 uncharacterized protein LOC100785875 isoform X2 [Glycine max]
MAGKFGLGESLLPCKVEEDHHTEQGFMAGMNKKVYQTRSSSDKEKAKYMVWTNEMDKCLTKVLAEQVKKGNKVDNILKPAAFAGALKTLNEKYGLYLTKEHIKNRLKTWRKQFGVLKELLAHSGFMWNETKKMVVADNSVWNDYIKAHPDARIFRAKSIENYDQLCTILGNDQAIASLSDNVTDIDVTFAVDKGDPDLAIVSEIQTDGNQTKNFRWTVAMDHWLGKILVDQVRKGLKVDKVFLTEAYNTAVSAVNAKFGLHLTKFNVKNRLKTWKKQFEQLKEILSHTGFKWDGTKKMIIANDSTWNDYIRTHLDARTFRGRVFENYDQFCIIFGHFYEPLHWDESGTCDETVEALSVYPVNYDISVGRHIRWTSDMDSCLSAILVQQIKQGNRSKFDYTLRPDAFEASVLAINEKFQLYLTKEHVKNRLRTWKKQYAILKELMTQSGFEWDEKRKMVIANDSVWTEYIKKNPDARILKGRVIRNYNELCIILGHCDPADSSINGACANMGMTTDDGVMEVQETKEKEKVKNVVTWTDEMDHCLTELLVNQVMLGNRLEKFFKTSAYIAALTALNERFDLNLTKENIINRLKIWKKQYDVLKEMLSQGRFEWDEGCKMVVATDLAWDEYIKKHPYARHLRDRHIENYHELGMIVGDEQGSGNWSENFERFDVNLTPNYEEHAEAPALVLADVQISPDANASDEVQGSSEQTRARPSSSQSHSKQPSKRRRTSDVMLEMMSVMAADISRIADALSENNKTVCLEEVVEKVQNMPDFDDDLIIEACEYLCFDEKRALMFLKLDERLRKKWLLKRLRGQGS